MALEHSGNFLQDSLISASPPKRSGWCRGFYEFAGSWPNAAWATQYSDSDPPELELLRWVRTRWMSQKVLRGQRALLAQGPQGGALLVTWPRKSNTPKYDLQVLGGGRAPVPKRAAPATACGTALVKPFQLLTNARGDIAVLGRACGAENSAVEHWAPGATTSTVHEFSGNVDLRTMTLTETGELWVAGGQTDPGIPASQGYLARFDGTRWLEHSAPPGETSSLAVSSGGELWAVSESLKNEPNGTTVPQPSEASRRDSSVWRWSASANNWQEVPLPALVGSGSLGMPRWVEASADGQVWLGTENALLLNGDDNGLAQPPTRLQTSYRGKRCSLPVSTARPVTYRRVPGPRPLQVRLAGNIVPNCDDVFFLVEKTTKPKSELWDQVTRALEADRNASAHDAARVVAFERGYYFFGFVGRGLRGLYKLHFFVKNKFPKVKELCADPIPIAEGQFATELGSPEPPRKEPPRTFDY